MPIIEWGRVCVLIIVVQLTSSQDHNFTTERTLETTTQNDTITTVLYATKSITGTGISRDVTGSRKGAMTTIKFSEDVSKQQLKNQHTEADETENITSTTSTAYMDMEKRLTTTLEAQSQTLKTDPNKVTVQFLSKITTFISDTTQSTIFSRKYIQQFISDADTSSQPSSSRESDQFTQLFTGKNVDQSSTDMTKSSTSHETQKTVDAEMNTTCANPDGKTADGRDFNETTLVLSVSLAVVVAVLFVCCICLIQRRYHRRKQTFTLPWSDQKQESLEQGVALRYIQTNGKNSTSSLDGGYKFYSVDLNDDEEDDAVFKTVQSERNKKRESAQDKPAVSTFLIGRTGYRHNSVSNHDIDNTSEDVKQDKQV